MDERWDRILFVRDKCLTGDPYKCNVSQSPLSRAYTKICLTLNTLIDMHCVCVYFLQGLETIPDEPEEKKK